MNCPPSPGKSVRLWASILPLSNFSPQCRPSECINIHPMRINQRLGVKPEPRGKSISHPRHDLNNLIAKKLIGRKTGQFVKTITQRQNRVGKSR